MGSSTPFDDDYFAADTMPEEEQDAILALNEFKEALEFFHEKKYDQAEVLLKEALKILKKAEQEKSMGYLYILKRLAYVCFCNKKYSESEKYFTVAVDLAELVTSNPANVFNAKMNLLVFHTHTDLTKANELGERMLMDIEETLPAHSKDLHFMIGNIHFLSGEFTKAKTLYRQTLKMSPKPVLEAQTLNNLAFCSFMHLLDLPKLKEKYEGQPAAEGEESGTDRYEQVKEQILREESYTMGYLRQSIELAEKTSNADLDLLLFRKLMDLDLEADGVESLSEEEE